MKKLKFLAGLFLALSIGLYGCKKKNDNPEITGNDNVIKTPSGKSCLLSKIKYGSGNDVFEYDSQNRPIKISYYNGTALEYYVTVAYSSSQVVVKEYEANGQLDATQTFTASNGVITGSSSTESWTSSGITYTEVVQQTYEHNADGFLTKATYNGTTTTNPASTPQSFTGSTVYTYLNGNLVSKTETYGNESRTTTYEYYTDKTNTLAPEDEELLLTKANKNPVKKRVETYNGGNSTETSNYTYTYDSDGLITKRIEVETFSQPGSIPNTNENTFEYSCK